MLSLKAQNQHFLTKSKVNLGFEHSVLSAIDFQLKTLFDSLSLTYHELVFDSVLKLVYIEIISL